METFRDTGVCFRVRGLGMSDKLLLDVAAWVRGGVP